MATFLESSKVKVFPTFQRDSANDRESFLVTEQNLTRLRQLSEDKNLNSYVIEDDDAYLIFIQGYYFKVLKTDLTSLNLGNNVWAYIQLTENTNKDYVNERLTYIPETGESKPTDAVYLDYNTHFHGLAFSSEELTGDNIYSVQVLEEETTTDGSASAVVPQASKLKLKLSELSDDSTTTNKFQIKGLNATNLNVTDLTASALEASSANVSQLNIPPYINTSFGYGSYFSVITTPAAFNDVKNVIQNIEDKQDTSGFHYYNVLSTNNEFNFYADPILTCVNANTLFLRTYDDDLLQVESIKTIENYIKETTVNNATKLVKDDTTETSYSIGSSEDAIYFSKGVPVQCDKALNHDIKGNAATATKLETSRTIQTDLSSNKEGTFDGASNVTPGVKGTLPVANGGTGQASLDDVTVGNACNVIGTYGDEYKPIYVDKTGIKTCNYFDGTFDTYITDRTLNGNVMKNIDITDANLATVTNYGETNFYVFKVYLEFRNTSGNCVGYTDIKEIMVPTSPDSTKTTCASFYHSELGFIFNIEFSHVYETVDETSTIQYLKVEFVGTELSTTTYLHVIPLYAKF